MWYCLAALWIGAAVVVFGVLALDPVVRKYGSPALLEWWERHLVKDISGHF